MSGDGNVKVHGLISQAGLPIPLKEISVDIKIIGFVAEVTSSLSYINKEENPVEAVFTFPVDDGSAVFSFEAEIEGRHIVAEIQEKEQAELTYNDAIEKGSTALLLKEDDTAGDIFQCTLGNLPPKTDAKISFSYVIELPQEPDGRLRFTLPTLLNPRYSPDVGGTVAAEGATYSSPEKIPYKFNMVANIRGYHKIKSVTSEQDKLNVDSSDNTSAKVALAEDFKFDHDLSFLVEYENCYTPQVVVEKGDKEAAGMMKEDLLMVNFYPKLEDTTMTTGGEYIFVIDRSGSMSNDRIKNAKEALFLFLKSLPADCYFNVISFGSDYSSLFKSGSAQYNRSNLKDALSLQKEMDANMGGTEIYQPFKHIYSKKVTAGRPRQIILLTDGEVGNTNELIGLVKSNAHNTRVFTVGIGSGVSSSLIKGVARAGNGKAEFIADKDRIQPKVVSLLKCATQPSVSNIELKWELPKEITACPIPKQPPTFLGIGERLCLYALLTGSTVESSDDPYGLTLTGECEGTPVEFKMIFSVSREADVDESAPLHRLAAKAQIKTLEAEEAALLVGDDFEWEGNSGLSMMTEIRQNMIVVSRSANIISKMTAFVAVDKEAQKQVEGEMVKRSCPVPVATREFTEGFTQNYLRGCGLYDASNACGALNSVIERGENLDGLDDKASALNLQSANFYKCSSALGSYSLGSAHKMKKKVGFGFGGFGLFSKMGNLFSNIGGSKRKSSAGPVCMAADNSLDCSTLPLKSQLSQDDKMLDMVELQEIDGHWPLTKAVTALLGVSDDAIKSADTVKDTDVITTVAVIVWLKSKFSDRYDEWEMIEKKAITWLSSKIDKEKNLDELLEETKQHLWPSGL